MVCLPYFGCFWFLRWILGLPLSSRLPCFRFVPGQQHSSRGWLFQVCAPACYWLYRTVGSLLRRRSAWFLHDGTSAAGSPFTACGFLARFFCRALCLTCCHLTQVASLVRSCLLVTCSHACAVVLLLLCCCVLRFAADYLSLPRLPRRLRLVLPTTAPGSSFCAQFYAHLSSAAGLPYRYSALRYLLRFITPFAPRSIPYLHRTCVGLPHACPYAADYLTLTACCLPLLSAVLVLNRRTVCVRLRS